MWTRSNPLEVSLLDTQWEKSKWKFARCFVKMLPWESPSETEAVSFYTILLKVYEFTSNTITDCLLDCYKNFVFDVIWATLERIVVMWLHKFRMLWWSVYLDDYKWRYLLFMKYPFTHDFNWCCKAILMVEEEYSIKVPIYPQNQNFV